MKINPIILVSLMCGMALFTNYLSFNRDIKPNTDAINRLRQDSVSTHTLLLECNGVISRANMDSSYYIKNSKR